MDSRNLLLVEDEPFLARVIIDSLKQKGYEVVHAPNGKKAYSLFQSSTFDLLVLDVMLPDMDGFALAKQFRKVDIHTPILFLTAKANIEDLVEGYQSGGNDYLKKPFSLEELFLRIDELLKRTSLSPATSPVSIGEFFFNFHRQELAHGDTIIKLSSRESDLLFLLYKNRNDLTERRTALLSLWGDDNFFHTRTMDVFITRLRKHLKKDDRVQILNVRGMGYKLIC